MRKDAYEPPKAMRKKPLYQAFSRSSFERPKKTAGEKAKLAAELQNNTLPNNPEFSNDFRTAMVKVLAKMNENSDDPANEVLKLLVSGEDQLQDELNKVIIDCF